MGLPKSFQSGKLSLFQSAVHKVIQDQGAAPSTLSANHPMMEQAATVLAAADAGDPLDKFAGTIFQCASLAVQAAFAAIAGNTTKAGEIRAQLQGGNCDLLWISSLAVFIAYYAGGKDPQYTNWTNLGDFVYPMPGHGPDGQKLTVGILADWGTGDPAIAKTSLEAILSFKPDLIVHLGDIYYSGTSGECENNFLKYINAAREHYPVPVWNLAGNHDYYSGGGPFYDLLKKLNADHVPPGTPIQQASFFCLRNQGWQIQAMDTGYYDHDIFTRTNDISQLHDTEVAWHLDKMNSAAGRKIVLLSHHQLYSAFQKIGTQANNYYNPNLLEPFKTQLNSGNIVAWLWGHEHLLEMYAPFPLLDRDKQPKGRCVGCSAFPMLASDHPYTTRVSSEQVPLLGDPPFLQTTGHVYNHGFVILTLADAYGQADYYSIPGDGSAVSQPLNPTFSENLWDAETVTQGAGGD